MTPGRGRPSTVRSRSARSAIWRRSSGRRRRGSSPGERGGQFTGGTDQGFAKAQIQLHRSRVRLADRRQPGSIGDLTPGRRVGVVGRTRLQERPHARAVEMLLVDRLGRADPPQFAGAVGGAHEHRHTADARFGHCRVEMCGRRARCAQGHRWFAGGQAVTERSETGRSLIVEDLDSDLATLDQRQRHGRRARPGGNEGGVDAIDDPLVHEGGAERGVGVTDRTHPNPTRSIATGTPTRRGPARDPPGW